MIQRAALACRVTGDNMVAAMDRVDVDGAIFISAFSPYRYDANDVVEAQCAHPGRFALAKPVDPGDPAVSDVIADRKPPLSAVGIRFMMPHVALLDSHHPDFDLILRAAARHDFPVNQHCGATLMPERR